MNKGYDFSFGKSNYKDTAFKINVIFKFKKYRLSWYKTNIGYFFGVVNYGGHKAIYTQFYKLGVAFHWDGR